MDDSEARGLLGDDRDVAGPRHRIAHAGVESALRKNANVRSGSAARRPLQGNRTAAQRARITCCVELPQRAVVGSTTTMSFPVATGALPLRAITSSETFGAATMSDTAYDFVPPGFWT